MRSLLKWGLLGLLIWLPACPAPPEEPDDEVKAIDERISKMETDLADLRKRIGEPDGDRGMTDKLREDEALMKSRIERLKERAKTMRSSPAPEHER